MKNVVIAVAVVVVLTVFWPTSHLLPLADKDHGLKNRHNEGFDETGRFLINRESNDNDANEAEIDGNIDDDIEDGEEFLPPPRPCGCYYNGRRYRCPPKSRSRSRGWGRRFPIDFPPPRPYR